MISAPKWIPKSMSSSKPPMSNNTQQRSPAVERAAVVAAAKQSRTEEELPPWAQRFMRQVYELPNDRKKLRKLLRLVSKLKAKAAKACGQQTAAVCAYLDLVLLDIVDKAWQQHKEELEQSLNVAAAQSHLTSRTSHLAKQHLDARLALSGCRYLRFEAAGNLAKQVHLLFDSQGYAYTVNVAALPQPHVLGLNFGQILQQGLGLDLTDPQVRLVPQEQLQCLQAVPFEKYHAVVTSDAALSGECWAFDYWGNGASLAPAPFAKFGTGELTALLTREAVLGSLENGVWGRAMLAAAAEVGITLQVAAEKEVAVVAGAGNVGSASAWLFLQSQLAETMQQDGLQRLQQLVQAVIAAAAALLQIVQQQQQQQ
ncbi:hypothetical protein COO60DRAFT_1635208 [Scenedesmus sp. NREL 46B-D3]|nr:hypothetical protein COO60DRAFT_1635208 [Scenedesmus sp. NREL 46B-D3]